jgi:hypothetical protein
VTSEHRDNPRRRSDNEPLTVAEIASLHKLNPLTIRSCIDPGRSGSGGEC